MPSASKAIAAGAADVGHEAGVVLVQHLRVEVADARAGRQVPVLDDALQVARREPGAVRVEGDVVDVRVVPFERARCGLPSAADHSFTRWSLPQRGDRRCRPG